MLWPEAHVARHGIVFPEVRRLVVFAKTVHQVHVAAPYLKGAAGLRSMTGVTGFFWHPPHMPQKTQMDFNQQRRAGADDVSTLCKSPQYIILYSLDFLNSFN